LKEAIRAYLEATGETSIERIKLVNISKKSKFKGDKYIPKVSKISGQDWNS